MANNDDFNAMADDIVQYVQRQARTNISYQALDDDIRGNRNDYLTTKLDNMSNNALKMFDFFYNDYRTDLNESQCWEEAIKLIADSAAAKIALDEPEVGDKMTDREYHKAQDDVEYLNAVLADYRRGSVRGSSRAVGARSRPGHNNIRGRGNERTSSQPARSRSMFTEDVGGVTRAAASNNARAAGIVNRAQSRVEQEVEESRRQNENLRNIGRNSRGRRQDEEVSSRNIVSQDVTYITNPLLLAMYPRHPDYKSIPEYNPLTQRLQAKLIDGFLHFTVLEVKEMDREAHETVIKTYVATSRTDEQIQGRNRTVYYAANGIGISPAMAESKAVHEEIDELVKAGVIKENKGFNGLTEEQKSDILGRVANKLSTKFELEVSEAKRKLIEEGNVKEATNAIEMRQVNIHQFVGGIGQAISRFYAEYGADLARDIDRRVGYSFTYNVPEILWRNEDPTRNQILYNALAGLNPNNATSEKLLATLNDKRIPLQVFMRLNQEATQAANEAAHYLLGVPSLTLDSFVTDLPDFAGWLIQQVNNGIYQNSYVDKVNRYICRRVCNLYRPKSAELVSFLDPSLDNDASEILWRNTVYTSRTGTIYWLPNLAGELGLTDGVNFISDEEQNVFNGMFSNVKVPGNDYVYTSDGIAFRYLGRDIHNNHVLMRESSLS